jgi:YggT family protein
VNGILCSFTSALVWLVNVYTLLLFVYALLSWIPDLRGRWTYYLASVIEPVLMPIRRIIPPVGGFDIAFLVLFAVLQFVVRPALAHAAFSACYLY